ncbi:beta-lactamase family protein [Muricauda sp. 2012CJ35-5]|uniref:Beta-lactamase family protein n=1 Tax=Flagellimonas spongiicola TaxID=2942208 RepID=A0ABT0PMM0_9FLAO|nr:serine hydrolase domain-containing protein [Allomuricauda spongiicola]MCL6272624.1 beta-lactamase family protein [Allomuricauda spongiicola]
MEKKGQNHSTALDYNLIHQVESKLTEKLHFKTTPTFDLQSQMEKYKVPGLALAVIAGDSISWVKGYGTAKVGGMFPVDENTIFQAASITKSITALLALKLEEEGFLSLDVDVNEYLKGWQLESPMGYATNVSIRQLLLHKAGTNIHGTGGYEDHQELPDLLTLLNGNAPSLSPKVQIVFPPNQEWIYSGGGYWVVQKALEDVSGKTFQQLANQYIFDPLTMTNSSFIQYESNEVSDAFSFGHQDGKIKGNGIRRYAGLASGGLTTSAKDFASLVVELINAYYGKGKLFSKEIIKKLMQSTENERYALGVMTGGDLGNLFFEHGGVNPGFTSHFIALPDEGMGMVVFANSEFALDLIDEITHSVANTYAWKSHQARIIENPRKLTNAETIPLLGMYQRRGEEHLAMWVDWVDGRCQMHLDDLKNPIPDPLYDEPIVIAENQFMLKKFNAVLTFEKKEGSYLGYKMEYGGGDVGYFTKSN